MQGSLRLHVRKLLTEVTQLFSICACVLKKEPRKQQNSRGKQNSQTPERNRQNLYVFHYAVSPLNYVVSLISNLQCSSFNHRESFPRVSIFFHFLLLIAMHFPVEIVLANASQFGTQDAMVTKVQRSIKCLLIIL